MLERKIIKKVRFSIKTGNVKRSTSRVLVVIK